MFAEKRSRQVEIHPKSAEDNGLIQEATSVISKLQVNGILQLSEDLKVVALLSCADQFQATDWL